MLGWESITTNGGVEDLIQSPQGYGSAFPTIYTVDDSANEAWSYAIYSGTAWLYYPGYFELEAGKGYYLDNFGRQLRAGREPNLRKESVLVLMYIKKRK